MPWNEDPLVEPLKDTVRRCECAALWHQRDGVHEHDRCENYAWHLLHGNIRDWYLCRDCLWINTPASVGVYIERILNGDLGKR